MTTQTRTQFRVDFFLAWVIANAIGVAIAGVTYVFLGVMPLVMLATVAGETLAEAANGALIGIIVGMAQLIVLQRYLGTSNWWPLTSASGWAIIGIVLWNMKIPTMTDVGFTGFNLNSTISQWAMIGALLGLSSGVFQILALPLSGRNIGVWLLLNTSGWLAAFTISWPLAVATRELWLGPTGCISGAIGGAISGVALTVLLHDSILPKKQKVRTNLPEQASKPAKQARFTVRDRVGGIGAFGMLFAFLALGVGETTIGALLLAVSAALLAYALWLKGRG